MASIQQLLSVSINPAQPVQEICDIIAAVLQYHPEREREILQSLKEAIDQHMDAEAQRGESE